MSVEQETIPRAVYIYTLDTVLYIPLDKKFNISINNKNVRYESLYDLMAMPLSKKLLYTSLVAYGRKKESIGSIVLGVVLGINVRKNKKFKLYDRSIFRFIDKDFTKDTRIENLTKFKKYKKMTWTHNLKLTGDYIWRINNHIYVNQISKNNGKKNTIMAKPTLEGLSKLMDVKLRDFL